LALKGLVVRDFKNY